MSFDNLASQTSPIKRHQADVNHRKQIKIQTYWPEQSQENASMLNEGADTDTEGE